MCQKTPWVKCKQFELEKSPKLAAISPLFTELSLPH